MRGRVRGVTLIELTIAIAVLAIILAAATPSLVDLVENGRIRSAAEQFRDAAATARLEAIKRNTTVAFFPRSQGWRIYIPGIGGTPDAEIETRTLGSSYGSVSASKSADEIRFNGAGRTDGFASLSVDFTSARGTCQSEGGFARCLRLTVSGGGQVRLCDPAIGSEDPRAC